jgi:phenylpropionate dioxygenase-like ring-hydroxylating dioxygenase large terminal subunit
MVAVWAAAGYGIDILVETLVGPLIAVIQRTSFVRCSPEEVEVELQTQRRLREELLDFIDNRSTDYAPDVMRVDPAIYYDPEYLQEEFEVAFGDNPVIVAHHSEITEPGGFLTVDVAGTALIVVRQDDGSVKAFANACRHRGAKVELADSGRRRMFACPYHKWCYSRDGSIRSIPFDDGFIGLDRNELGLVEYPAIEYAGFIWSKANPGTELDMPAYIGSELEKDVIASKVADAKLYQKRTFHLDMNWKVVMDGFTDAYHLQFVHPETVGPFFHTNIYKCDIYDKNWRMTVARRGVVDFRDSDLTDGEFPKYAIAGLQFYPGNIIARAPAHFEVWAIRPNPENLSKCVVTLWFMVDELPVSDKAKRFREKNWEIVLKAVEGEDWVVAKTVTDVLPRSKVPDLFFGRNEKATQHLHRTIACDIEAARAKETST